MEDKVRNCLIECLKAMDWSKDYKIVITLMLKSDNQALTMIDWLVKHQKENPSQELGLEIAKQIVKDVK